MSAASPGFFDADVVVCSSRAIKMSAVSLAIGRLRIPSWEGCVTYVNFPSGVPRQPYGDRLTMDGAMNRAHAARARFPARVVISIENGIAPRDLGFIDLAYVVVLDSAGRITVRRSAEIPVPSDLVERSRESGWTIEVGSMEAERTPGAAGDDPHLVWSDGTRSRRDILADAVANALSAAARSPMPML